MLWAFLLLLRCGAKVRSCLHWGLEAVPFEIPANTPLHTDLPSWVTQIMVEKREKQQRDPRSPSTFRCHRVIPFITLTDLLAFTEEALPVGRFQPVLETPLGITSTRSLPDTPHSCIKPCSYLLQSCPMFISIFIALITYGLCSRLKCIPKKLCLSPNPQYL